MSGFQVAIDGPVAAGKSTIAKELAKSTGFVYIDTGAMYRAVTLAVLRNSIDVGDEDSIVELVGSLDIDVRSPLESENDGRLSTVLLDGEDVSWEIRNEAVSKKVASVASLPKVREVLVDKQRKVAEGKDVVMEGRDITYVVLPDAQLKIFLTADETVRVDRYYKKMHSNNESITVDEVAEMLRKRDELDRTRETSPLKIVDGAWVLDTSDLTIDEVVDKIKSRINELRD